MRLKLIDKLAFKASIGTGFKAPDFRQLFFNFTNSSVGYSVFGANVALEKFDDLDSLNQVLGSLLVPRETLLEELKPESSRSYNAGLTFNTNLFTSEVNFFRNDIKNLIDTYVIARKVNGQNIFSYRNFDSIYTTGVEFNTSYKPVKNLEFSAGYQLLYAFDKEDEARFDTEAVFARDSNNNPIEIQRSDYFGLVNRSRHHANFKVF